jgi:hypothetical protein
MNWLLNLIRGKKDEEYTGASDVAARVAEIQARISAIKSRNGWDEKPNKDIKVQSRPLVAETILPKKTVGSEDLKARLLSLKK